MRGHNIMFKERNKKNYKKKSYLKNKQLIGRSSFAEPQIKWANMDNSEIISLFRIENICFDPSLALSCQDGSNEESQRMFLCQN